MVVSGIVTSLIAASAIVLGGLLTWLGTRGRNRIDDRQNYVAGLRDDLEKARAEAERQDARATALQLRYDTERDAWLGRQLAADQRIDQLESETIRMRRAIQRAGMPDPTRPQAAASAAARAEGAV